jgi:hypothetical protein
MSERLEFDHELPAQTVIVLTGKFATPPDILTANVLVVRGQPDKGVVHLDKYQGDFKAWFISDTGAWYTELEPYYFLPGE